MIGLDSDVLLRVLISDDAPQAARARRLIEAECAGARRAYVNRGVLLEALWTLASGYRYSRAQLADAVEVMLSSPELVIEDGTAVAEALDLFRRTRADFADLLIGVTNRRAGCATTYTFDRAAAEAGEFTAVA